MTWKAGASIAVALLGLAGCNSAPAPVAPMAPAAPFTIPMDPGSIRCTEIAANPAALAAATDWTMGRLRAEVMSGAREALPGDMAASSAIASACAGNPDARLVQIAGGLPV